MRITIRLSLLAALAVPALAEANCYSVYDSQNRLTYQSAVAPIDLSLRISEAMRTRFPAGYMIMVPDESVCREFRTGGTVQPRFDNIGLPTSTTPNEQLLQASPLLRDTRSTGYANDVQGAGGNDLASREAARSGNNLNIKREAAPRP